MPFAMTKFTADMDVGCGPMMARGIAGRVVGGPEVLGGRRGA